MGHALLSPSAMARIIACPPSARLGQFEPDSAGIAAEEGTHAHYLADQMLKLHQSEISKAEFNHIMIWIRSAKDSKGNVMYNEAMQIFVENYVDAILAAMGPDSLLFCEKKVYFNKWVREGDGTTDASIVTGDLLDFWDLKYGKGFVSAEDNAQLKCYALGLLELLQKHNDFSGTNHRIKRIRLNIYQPRIGNHSIFELSVKELLEWAENTLAPAAKDAWDGVGEMRAGSHCKFCKVAGKCAKLAEYSTEMLKEEFSDYRILSDSKMLDIYGRIDIVKSWAASVEAHMLREALAGKKWKGLKLVESKTNRVYTDTDKIEKECLAAGYEEIYMPTQLLGITALSKNLSKKVFDQIAGPYIKKPRGSPQLAPRHDSREVYNTAKSDFAQVTDNLDFLN